MLRRYKYKLTGPYNKSELQDIYKVSQYLHLKVATGEKSLNELEKDYIRYSKQVFWYYTKYPALMACAVFLVSDWVYPISAWRFFPRMGVKLTCGYLVLNAGIQIAYEKVLEFPMLDTVIAEAIMKYTDWVELSNSD